MEWATIKAALAALFASISGLPVRWRDEARGFVEGGKVCLLNPIAVVGLGVDELRHRTVDVDGAPTEDPGEIVAVSNEAAGLRTITLSVQVEMQDQRIEAGAMSVVEQVRSRLAWPSSLAALAAAGLALVRVGGATALDYTYDNRNYGRAACDVFLAAASNTEDAESEFIETIVLTTEVADEAGNVLPSPPNLTDEELP